MNSLRSPLFYFSISFYDFAATAIKFKIKNHTTTTFMVSSRFLVPGYSKPCTTLFVPPIRLACTLQAFSWWDKEYTSSGIKPRTQQALMPVLILMQRYIAVDKIIAE